MGKSGLQGYLTSAQDALLRGFWQVRCSERKEDILWKRSGVSKKMLSGFGNQPCVCCPRLILPPLPLKCVFFVFFSVFAGGRDSAERQARVIHGVRHDRPGGHAGIVTGV